MSKYALLLLCYAQIFQGRQTEELEERLRKLQEANESFSDQIDDNINDLEEARKSINSVKLVSLRRRLFYRAPRMSA